VQLECHGPGLTGTRLRHDRHGAAGWGGFLGAALRQAGCATGSPQAVAARASAPS